MTKLRKLARTLAAELETMAEGRPGGRARALREAGPWDPTANMPWLTDTERAEAKALTAYQAIRCAMRDGTW